MWPVDKWTNETYVYYNNAFSNDEVNTIIQIGKNLHTIDAVVGGNEGRTDGSIRKSKVSWLTLHKDYEWIWSKVSKITYDINNEFFKYDLTNIESLQYTEYDESYNGYYSAHTDRGYDTMINRKLSFVLQLSDASEYEGGELLLYGDSLKPLVAPKEKGMLVFFSGFTLHEVTPVTKGNRKTLVGWVNGPRFR